MKSLFLGSCLNYGFILWDKHYAAHCSDKLPSTVNIIAVPALCRSLIKMIKRFSRVRWELWNIIYLSDIVNLVLRVSKRGSKLQYRTMHFLTLCKASRGKPFHSASTIDLPHKYLITFLFQSVHSIHFVF